MMTLIYLAVAIVSLATVGIVGVHVWLVHEALEPAAALIAVLTTIGQTVLGALTMVAGWLSRHMAAPKDAPKDALTVYDPATPTGDSPR